MGASTRPTPDNVESLNVEPNAPAIVSVAVAEKTVSPSVAASVPGMASDAVAARIVSPSVEASVPVIEESPAVPVADRTAAPRVEAKDPLIVSVAVAANVAAPRVDASVPGIVSVAVAASVAADSVEANVPVTGEGPPPDDGSKSRRLIHYSSVNATKKVSEPTDATEPCLNSSPVFSLTTSFCP